MDAPTNLNGYEPHRDADGYWFDEDEAALVCDFFPEMLCHTQAYNGAFKLEGWQRDIIATLYGWRRRSDGTRRYREALVAVPRKNGKTTLAAGLALYGLLCDKEPGAQVYSAAFSREQATLVFEPAAAMVRANPDIAKVVNVIDSTKRMVVAKTRSFYRAIPAEAANSHGFSASTVIFDELHTQKHRTLYDVLRTSRGARAKAAVQRGRGGPLFASITTAGHDRNSICWEVWEHGRKVRDGVIPDPEFLPVIYEAAPEDDWTSEDVWRRVNPNLGVSLDIEFLRSEYKHAKNVAAYENTFRNLYLNQWTQSAVRWFSLNDWDECRGELPNLEGEQCWAGLDMSTTQDVTAFVMAFALDDRVILVPHFWIPADTAEKKERTDRVPYRLWQSQGFITFTNGVTVDHDKVRHDINQIADRYAIQEICADRWNATQILTQLAEQDGFNVVQHGQGMAGMTGPAKEFERLVVGHKLLHDGHPVLRWMADNVMVETDASENIKPTKAKSTGRIDGIVASVMACGRAVSVGSAYWTPSAGV